MEAIVKSFKKSSAFKFMELGKLGRIVREVYYFDEPGKQNTDHVLEAVSKYISEKKSKYLIIASTSGRTALKFAEALKDRIKIICISEPPSRQLWGDVWPTLDPDIKKKLEELNVTVVDYISYKFHSSVLEHAKWYFPLAEHIVGDTLAMVGGQGLKVAVQIIFMAVEAGLIKEGEEVLAVAGYGGGSDTAIVAKAGFPEMIFSADVERRFEVREILAMPKKKKWWKWDERSCLKR